MELSPVFPLRDETYRESIEDIQKEAEPVPTNLILNGVVAYVEVRSNAENRSQAISSELQELGAIVSNRLNGTITHVVFREGRKRTKDWANRHRVPLMSVGWIQACKRKQRRISEAGFELFSTDSGSDEASPITGIPVKRRLRSMQPKDLDEELKLSAERKLRASRRNARRNALHQRAVEAEKNLQSLEIDTARNYFANPCIRVPRTPPSMKEFTERLERRRDASDTESPSTRNSLSTTAPRRRLFSSPSCQAPHEISLNLAKADDISENVRDSTVFSPRRSISVCSHHTENDYHSRMYEKEADFSPMRSDTPIKSGRKLFNASAFEASGVIIEPKYSSNRLQDISQVFPKSFRKRNILPLSKVQGKKRKRPPSISSEDMESAEAFSDLQISSISKPRRVSSVVLDDTDYRMANDNVLPCSSRANHVRSEELVSTDNEDEEIEGVDIGGSQNSRPSSVSAIRQSLSSKPHIKSPRNSVSDVLEVIDQTAKFRNFIKKPPFGCSFARRKSVRFSDVREESPVFERSQTSTDVDDTKSKSPVDEFHEETPISTMQSSPVIRRRRSAFANKNSNQTRLRASSGFLGDESATEEKSVVSDISHDTEENSINMGVLIEAIKSVSQTPDIEKTPSSTAGSPKRRRSNRLKDHIQAAAGNETNESHSNLEDSSSTRQTSVSTSGPSSRPENDSSLHIPSPELSSRSSIVVGQRQPRLRYSYEFDSYDPKSDEEVYGVLLAEPSSPRKSKRLSIQSVVKALMESPIVSRIGNQSSTQKIPQSNSRTSIDDFKTGKVSSRSRYQPNERSMKQSNYQEQMDARTDRASRRKSIVFTSLHKEEQELGKKSIASLGNCKLNQSVVSTTTHVVTNWPIRRTLNLLRGVVFGCHIVTLSWLIESREAGFWLPEEDYRINEVPTPDNNPSIRKLFQSFEGIYVDSGVSPPQKELKALVQLAGGKIAHNRRSAAIVVSSQSGESACVSPKWILDSIIESEALPIQEYQMNGAP